MIKKSEYKISTSVNEEILEFIITGEVIERDVKNLTNEVIAIIKANGVANVLFDVRAIKGRYGYLEASSRVSNYPPDIPRVNTAVVDIPENTKYQSLNEVTSINAGLSFKRFTDIDAARDWLKSK